MITAEMLQAEYEKQGSSLSKKRAIDYAEMCNSEGIDDADDLTEWAARDIAESERCGAADAHWADMYEFQD